MSNEQNVRVSRRLIEEGFSKGDMTTLDKLFAANFKDHQNGMAPPNIEGVKGAITDLRAAFPDLELTIEEIVSVGDKV